MVCTEPLTRPPSGGAVLSSRSGASRSRLATLSETSRTRHPQPALPPGPDLHHLNTLFAALPSLCRSLRVEHSTPPPPPPSTTNMCQPPPDQAVGAVLSRASVDGHLERILRIPSSRPQRPYHLQLGGGKRLVLVTAPPSRLRLLRCEQRSTSTEAAVIRWLAETLPSSPPGDGSLAGPAHDDPPEGRSDTAARLPETFASDFDLAGAVPRLVVQSRASDELGSPYNILDAPEGTAIRSLQPPLTASERDAVDYAAGSLARQLSSLTPRPPRFGPALAVLSAPSPTSSSSRRLTPRPTTSSLASDGLSSWSVAFHSLLESALRDGEDMAVVLPYSAIRKHFRRLGYLLGMVTVPRLVVLDAAEDDNLLVTRQPPATPASKNWRAGGEATESASPRRSKTPESPVGRREEKDRGDEDERGGEGDGKGSAYIAVAGLRDWSQAVFGDPLLASAFCDGPSTEFQRGFDGPPHGDRPLGAVGDDLIEDREMAPVRILLYRCYHLVVAIAKEYYRPANQGTAREMAARKNLGETLMKLADVEDAPKRRHRRPSGEMSPAKKLRSDTPDGDEGSEGKKREEPTKVETGATERGP